jgi:hypothetical protein
MLHTHSPQSTGKHLRTFLPEPAFTWRAAQPWLKLNLSLVPQTGNHGNNLFVAPYSKMIFDGSENLILNYKGATVDAYGVVGVDHAYSNLNFEIGWVLRNSDTAESAGFNPADWNLSDNAALSSFPNTNADQFRLGNYQ